MAEEMTRQRQALTKRLLIVCGIVGAFVVLVTLVGFASYLRTQSQRQDDLHRFALANCHRSQDGRKGLVLALYTLIPPNDLPPSPAIGAKQKKMVELRTSAERDQVSDLYRSLNRLNALRIPRC